MSEFMGTIYGDVPQGDTLNHYYLMKRKKTRSIYFLGFKKVSDKP